MRAALCPPELFLAFLIAFYGPTWRRYAPRALGVSDRTLRGYVYGERPVPLAVLKRLLNNAEHRPSHFQDCAKSEHARIDRELHERNEAFHDAVQCLRGMLNRPPLPPLVPPAAQSGKQGRGHPPIE